MGWFSKFTGVVGDIVGGGMDIVAAVGRNPVAQMLPGVGLASSIVGGTRAITNVFDGGGGATMLPALPSAGFGQGFAGFDPNPGVMPRGPGGKLSIPFTNPNVPPQFEPFVIDDQFLRISLRAPKGYVVIRLQGIKPFPMRRDMAIKFGVWKPAKKPPISVTDWESLKRADKVIRKLKVVVKRGQNIANWTPPTRSRPKLKNYPAQKRIPSIVNIDNS